MSELSELLNDINAIKLEFDQIETNLLNVENDVNDMKLYGLGEIDPRIDEMIKEYEHQQHVADVINDGNKFHGYADISVNEAAMVRESTPLLPKITNYTLPEFYEMISDLAKGAYHAESFDTSLTIMPLVTKLNVGHEMQILLRGVSLGKYVYVVTHRGSSDYNVNVAFESISGERVERQYTIKEYDMMRLDTVFHQHQVTQSFGSSVLDPNDTQFKTYIKESDFNSKIDVVSQSVIYITRANLKQTGVYEKAIVEKEVLIDRYLSEYGHELLGFDHVEFKTSDDVTDFLSINAVEANAIIEGDIAKDRVLDFVTLFNDKIEHWMLINSFVCQEAGYLSEAEKAFEDVVDIAETPVDTLLVDTAQTLVTITDVLKNVSQYLPAELALDVTSVFTTNLKMVDMKVESEQQSYVLVNPGDSIDVAAVNKDSKKARLRGGNLPADPGKTRVDSNVATIYEDDERMVLMKYVITVVGLGNYLRTELFYGYDRFIYVTAEESGQNILSVTVKSATSPNYSIPVSCEVTQVTYTVKEIIIVDKLSTARIGEIVMDNETKNVLDLAFADQLFTLELSTPRSAEAVINGLGTLYGVGFDVDANLTFRLNQNLIMNPRLEGGIITRSHTATGYYNSGIYDWRNSSYWYSAFGNGVDDYFEAFYVSGEAKDKQVMVQIKPDAKIVFERLDTQDAIDYAKLNGKTLDQMSPPPLKSTRYAHLMKSLGVALKCRIGYKRQLAPINLSERLYLNQYNTMQDKINWQLSYDVDHIVRELEDVTARVKRLEDEVEKLKKAVHPPFYKLLLKEIEGYIIGGVVAFVVGKALSELARQLGNLRRVTAAIWGASVNARKAFRTDRAIFYPRNALALAANFIDDIAGAMHHGDLLRRFRTTSMRPGFRHGNSQLQLIDVSEKVDLITAYFLRGVVSDKSDIGKLIPHFNVKAGELPMPELRVFYKPLDIIPKPLNVILHDTFTNRDKVRKQLIYNKQRAGILKPSHSFATFENYNSFLDGVVERELVFMGIGEFSRVGEIGGKIGGVHIKYLSDSVDKTTGVRIFKPTDYATNGYNEMQVHQMFKSVYKVKDHAEMNGYTASDKWDIICRHVDKRITTGTKMYESYVPDDGIGEAYKKLIDNPPDFQYNLLSNNCQSFTNALINYQTKGIINPAWSGTLEQYLVGPRINFINNVITGLSETAALTGRSIGVDAIDSSVDYDMCERVVDSSSVVNYDMYKRGIFTFYVDGDVQYISDREMTYSVISSAK